MNDEMMENPEWTAKRAAQEFEHRQHYAGQLVGRIAGTGRPAGGTVHLNFAENGVAQSLSATLSVSDAKAVSEFVRDLAAATSTPDAQRDPSAAFDVFKAQQR